MFLSEFRKGYSAQQVAGDEGRRNFVEAATAAWRRLSRGEKADYSLRARGLNSLRSRSSQMSEEEAGLEGQESGGLWNTCLLQDKWPLRVDVLKAAMGEGNAALRNLTAAWEEAWPIQTSQYQTANSYDDNDPLLVYMLVFQFH